MKNFTRNLDFVTDCGMIIKSSSNLPVPEFAHSIQTGTPVRYNCGIYKMSLLLLAVISWRSKPH